MLIRSNRSNRSDRSDRSGRSECSGSDRSRSGRSWVPRAALAAAVLVGAMAAILGAQQTAAPRTWEWPTYGADLASTRYAPLDQIDKDNFSTLEVAWRFRTDNLGPRPEFNYQSTPLMVGGVVYTTAGSRRHVVALDAATGELLWNHREDEGQRGQEAPRQLSGRGLAYWSDGKSARIIYVTPGYRMIALDARTGARITSFGRNGEVDLKLEMDQEMDPVTGDVGLHAAPVIARDVVIIGAAHTEGSRPVSRRNDKGYVRGYDVRTGRRLWIFHTIPRPGEVGYDTWKEGSEEYTGNTGVWAQISVDEKLGTVYLPTEMPTGDYYGGHRPGDNLFGSGIVAVDLRTGKRKWHYQFIRHDIWDWDVPCAPILADVTIDGRVRQIVAQPAKQGWVYVFDRVTGQPVWPIEERPVEQSDVPGEQSSPTQRFVMKPPPFDRQGVSIDDLIDFTPELRAEAVKLVSRFKIGPIFTPPVVSRYEGPLATLMLPNATGGANWQGGSLDPETGILYMQSRKACSGGRLGAAGERDDGSAESNQPGSTVVDFISAGGGGFAAFEGGLPIFKPPYGRITAVDMNTGEHLWWIPNGDTPDRIEEHPLVQDLELPNTGYQGDATVLVTRTLLMWAEGRGGRPLWYAADKQTGERIGAVEIPASSTTAPMTFMHEGVQYIVVSIAGQDFPGSFAALRLPG